MGYNLQSKLSNRNHVDPYFLIIYKFILNMSDEELGDIIEPMLVPIVDAEDDNNGNLNGNQFAVNANLNGNVGNGQGNGKAAGGNPNPQNDGDVQEDEENVQADILDNGNEVNGNEEAGGEEDSMESK